MESTRSLTCGLAVAGAFVAGAGLAAAVRRWRAIPEVRGAAARDETDSAYDSEEWTDAGDDEEELKMVLCVRTDLKMGKGKAAAQCCHAAIGAFRRSIRKNREQVKLWERLGAAKITLKVQSEEEMDRVARAADAKGIVTYIVEDAGRTQIPAGSRTVLALGPAPVSLMDTVTGRGGEVPLKLLS